MPDASDIVRDAIRAEVQTVLTAAGISWPIKEVSNEYAAADGTTNFIAIEFAPAASERQLTTGQRGNNLWREDGTVHIRLIAPLNAGKSPVEGYASSIRTAFRDRRFTRSDGREILTASGPPDSFDNGARWIHSVSIAYRTQNRG
jgi:hypothetical protein